VTVQSVVAVPHVVKGQYVAPQGGVVHPGLGVVHPGVGVVHPGVDGADFVTPALEPNDLVWKRTEALPAADVPLSEIIDLLVATGERLHRDPDGYLGEALEKLARTSPYERRILENAYADIGVGLTRESLSTQVELELGSTDVLDGWVTRSGGGRTGAVRAFPVRIVHVLAGNAPGVAISTIVRAALTKGVHLLKMPSNDLFTATAILRTMSAVAPDHPVCRSFSAVYWRGGDIAVEQLLFRAQFFDKISAWGGEASVRNAAKYLGPGFELVAFDPKSSISMIGAAAHDSKESIALVAARAAADSVYFNQEACTTSRFHFVEGTIEQVDAYCAALLAELVAERRYTTARLPEPSREIRDEIDALASLEPLYRVFGRCDGQGLVIRSDEPVDFFPSAKTVNVVAVGGLSDALPHVSVATQTVGIYPDAEKIVLRDALMAAGAQRVVSLGRVSDGSIVGFPHDGFYPLHRFVRWVADES
jgi:Acyl-CoA reductase (LuxC)